MKYPFIWQNYFPETVHETNTYALRNNDNYATVARRLEIYSKSVIPSSIKIWNNLDIDTRNSQTLSEFKYKLKQNFKPPEVPSFFLFGDRFLQVHHARIRNNCSNLNSDLHNNHLRDNSSCQCGSPLENADHYFFKCPLYSNQRRILFTNTRIYHPLSAKKLLFGIERLTDEQNKRLFQHIYSYIRSTRRFENN